MAITLADFNKIWASTSPLTPYSFSESNYKQGWNFIGSTPPARQMWDYLQKQNDEKMQYLANNYLPLSGGQMSGEIIKAGVLARGSSDDYFVGIYGGTTETAGARLGLRAKNHGNQPGSFLLNASDGTNQSPLIGFPDGTLTWGGNNVITSAGGTFSSPLHFNIQWPRIDCIYSNDEGSVSINGGSSNNSGGRLVVYGQNNSNHNGHFDLIAISGSLSKSLTGKPDGTLTWNGQPIQTSSDKRLKQDFSAVPTDVLEIWGKVEWKQFKYKADVEQKGDSCRFHTGLVAQDVHEVCGDEILKYGILCHDVREAVEEEKDENGNVIREASEAVDLWTVRYEEALAMEVIYLRNEIKKLREEISKLK